MSAFGIGAVCFGLAMIVMGVLMAAFRRHASALLLRRAERASAAPSFMMTAPYLLFVGCFGGALGVAPVVIGLLA